MVGAVLWHRSPDMTTHHANVDVIAAGIGPGAVPAGPRRR
jgi:hypothetical protein